MRVYSVSQTQVSVQRNAPHLNSIVQSRNESLAGAWDLAKKIGKGTTNILGNSVKDAVNCLRKNAAPIKKRLSKAWDKVKNSVGKVRVTAGGIASGILGGCKSVGKKLVGVLIDCATTLINLVRDFKKGDPNFTQASYSICVAAPSAVAGSAVAGGITAATGGAGTAVGVAAGIGTAAVVSSVVEPICRAAYKPDEVTELMSRYVG